MRRRQHVYRCWRHRPDAALTAARGHHVDEHVSADVSLTEHRTHWRVMPGDRLVYGDWIRLHHDHSRRVRWLPVADRCGTANMGVVSFSCASRRFCVAIGGNTKTWLGATFNGSAWKAVPLPTRSGEQLDSISCPAAGACVAVGSKPSRPSSAVRRHRCRCATTRVVLEDGGARPGRSYAGRGLMHRRRRLRGRRVAGPNAGPFAERLSHGTWSSLATINPNPGTSTVRQHRIHLDLVLARRSVHGGRRWNITIQRDPQPRRPDPAADARSLTVATGRGELDLIRCRLPCRQRSHCALLSVGSPCRTFDSWSRPPPPPTPSDLSRGLPSESRRDVEPHRRSSSSLARPVNPADAGFPSLRSVTDLPRSLKAQSGVGNADS